MKEKTEEKGRIDNIMILLEAEAKERIKKREKDDLVKALYDVKMDIDQRIMEIMRKWREKHPVVKK